ncbi:MAG: glycosyltransferase family 39 protein [Bradymonadaceae bacterium]|nr:glycosyltransferase family 39 protein [Lujinxingiaceae bacterium]
MNPTPSPHWKPTPLNWLDWVGALALFAGTLGLFLATMKMGFTRDEGFYFHAAYQYIRWFEELWVNFGTGDLALSFSQANIDKHWNYNPEHPVLMKTLFALSHKLFHETLGWMSASTAMRLPGALSGAVVVSTVFLFGRQLFGRAAGIIAAGAILFQPHFFFHSHLSCFDVPIVALWVAVVYAYWRSYESRYWALLTGLLWGLALSTKLNAFFLPFVLGLHWLIVHWRWFGLERDQGGVRLRIPPIPWAVVSMAVFGPLLFYALWPRHWFDTFARIKWYINFHMRHEHYFVQYFGENIQQPPLPISYPWVMTLVTVPATILLGFAIGVGYYVHRRGVIAQAKRWIAALGERRLLDDPGHDPRGTGWLFAINILFPITLIAMPETPIFGGTKHWMPAMPFVAIFCGAGAVWAARAAADALGERFQSMPPRIVHAVLVALLAISVLAPAIYATAYNHPFGTGYYNELIGSHRGAADRLMARQFWGHVSSHGLPYVNEHAEKGAGIWTHKVVGSAWQMYRREDSARKDLRAGSYEASQFALYHQQKEFMYLLIPLWQNFGTYAPAHVVGIDGVPMLSVYERPKKAAFKHPTK